MARLRRTSPDQPGWTRRRCGRGFVYLDGDGRRLAEEDARRCRDLVIPPAWTEVWICPSPQGHLQVVGRDDAGRRQYLYHQDGVARRGAEKHARVQDFGAALPRVRRRVARDLDAAAPDLAGVCAVAVRMLDLGCFRIGSDVYAEENGSFGLTTLERRHVRRQGAGLRFEFVGKSGVEHRIEVSDPAVVSALDVLRSRRAPDQRLLRYRSGRRWRPLSPADVNDYLREVSGLHATAKDFRTWHATVLAAEVLAEAPPAATSRRARTRAITAAMREVADLLGNTPTLARSAYVDPRVVDAYEEGRTLAMPTRRPRDEEARRRALERATLRLLEET